MLENREDILRWHTIFSLLSMERVEPFLPEMGLNLSNADAMRLVARRFLEQYEQRTGDKAEDEVLVQQTFAQISQMMSNEVAQDIYRWGTQRFPYEGSDDSREFIWGILLRRLAGLGSMGYVLAPLALSESKVKTIVQAIRDHLGDYLLLERQMQEVEQLPKSDWEERVYQRYEPDCSPLDRVEGAIEFHRLRKAWERIKSLLNAEEAEILFQWGKAQAQEMNIPLGLVKLPF